ncbi:MAG: A24 family peptidase [Comamonas sp.]|jgi:hypothetical protein|nr:A24 family peptidase [Comamonas sp.]
MTPFIAATFGGILCALIASAFLAPLVFKIPLRISRQWAREVDEYADLELNGNSLATPLTRTQSALLILASALLGCTVIAAKGLQIEGIALAFYFLSLLLLVAINLKALLLPDVIVLPVLWAGLLYRAQTGFAAEHIYGATVAYLVPFLLTTALQRFTGKGLIGHGDLKAMAMAGAWFGLAGLPLFFMGFVAGLVLWIVLLLITGQKAQGPICSGPAHLSGGLTAAFCSSAFTLA